MYQVVARHPIITLDVTKKTNQLSRLRFRRRVFRRDVAAASQDRFALPPDESSQARRSPERSKKPNHMDRIGTSVYETQSGSAVACTRATRKKARIVASINDTSTVGVYGIWSVMCEKHTESGQRRGYQSRVRLVRKSLAGVQRDRCTNIARTLPAMRSSARRTVVGTTA